MKLYISHGLKTSVVIQYVLFHWTSHTYEDFSVTVPGRRLHWKEIVVFFVQVATKE